ncbi:hypothetical protein DRE_04912 [Drechslerella stenobrocha 248]|uniref:Uncharacterized protein n=1 Tax=Drechslerella stenobrocha 248 TaxID=1043628 RepID=W7IA23_9PEZI|nr:hypothetical protein DRE_04912 [Drechslerella stenobrocha 248]
MAFLGSPPQPYWPSQFVADPAFDPELAAVDDAQQSALPHSVVHHQPSAADNAAAIASTAASITNHHHHHHHILDPALSDDMPPPQGQHPIIFHQTSPHSYAPPPFDTGLPPPVPDQIFSPTRIRAASSKDLHTHNNGEVVMDDGHGAAYIAPAQHPFLGNGMHHPDMHQPQGQPPQIKFRATTSSNSASGSHGRRPKMTKEEQMARRQKEDRERMRRDQEDQLRAEGKESWIAPTTAAAAAAAAAPKRKTVKMVKKKAPVAAPATGDEDDTSPEADSSREGKRQAKLDSRTAAAAATAAQEVDDGLAAESIDMDDSLDGLQDEGKLLATNEESPEEEEDKSAEDLNDAIEDHEAYLEKSGDVADDAGSDDREEHPEESNGKKETATRTSVRRAALGKGSASTPPARPTRSTAKAAPNKPAPAARSSRSTRSAGEPEKVLQEITTTRSGRTTRSALSTKPPVKEERKESPTPTQAAAATTPAPVTTAAAAASTPPALAPLKITTRKQTVTTAASPSSPAVSKTRVSLKSLSTSAVAPSTIVDAKSPSSVRTEPKSGQSIAPVVMLFGYPAGANPPCDVSSVSVTVESTKTNKICMMTADDMRRPATPAAEGEAEAGDKMDIDGEKEDLEVGVLDSETPPAPDEKQANPGSPPAQRLSSTPDANANGRFSWDLVGQLLKADIGFDPATDELVGFHHKDPLLLSCDRHLNTAMTMAAKEGVRMPKWYVYEKQQQQSSRDPSLLRPPPSPPVDLCSRILLLLLVEEEPQDNPPSMHLLSWSAHALSLGLLVPQLPTAAAWGYLGHKTVALLASRHLLPETASFVRSLLYRDQTIMDAAVWADRYAHVPLGRYSKGWHYIDARDEPPTSCGIQYNRDCGDDGGKGGCVVSALVNMTSRLQDDTLPWPQRAQALRFVLHFLGDIHQPLHTEHLARGGNGVHVRFHNHDTNLHSIWDSAIIEAAHGRASDRSIARLTDDLYNRLSDGGMYAADKEHWRSCLNVSDVQECALQWANESNAYICSYVLAGEVEGKELGGDYADGAVPIIERMIAAAGYRLAGWLNMIVCGRDGLEEQAEGGDKLAGFGQDEVDKTFGMMEMRDREDVEIDAAIAEYESKEGLAWQGLRVQG